MHKPTIFTKDAEFKEQYGDQLNIVLLPDDSITVEAVLTIDDDTSSYSGKITKVTKKKSEPVETTSRKKRKPTQCSACQGFGHTAKTCGRQSSEGDTPPANTMGSLPIDEHEHTYIIDMKNQGKPAMVIAQRLSLPIREVNRALQFTTYEGYIANYESHG